MTKLALSDEILMKIDKPARYIGNELNSVVKEKDTVDIRFVMCFPDVYEIGMSHLGIQILYDMLNKREDVWCERVYSPWPDLHAILKEENIPLFSLESQQPVKDADFLGITIQYEMCYTNILQILDLSQIPIEAADRTENDPILIGGGPCTYNPEPIAEFFDLFYMGEGEISYDALLDLYKKMKQEGASRKDFLHEAAKIPGIYVDAVVECPADDPKQSQSINCTYDPAYAGNTQVPVSSLEPKKLDAKKIIGRRAAMELKKNVVVNLGVGVPEWVSSVAAEEGVADEMTLTVECGPVGGVPGGGLRFGGSVNAQAYMDEGYQFDFYDGGGLDLCFLGLAEVDNNGDVNVSRLGTRITGSGGFTNISSNSKKAVFCGTFTNGVKIQTGDGKLTILEEGKKHKFVKKVTEITFSGVVAGKAGKDVLYVTERAVFALKADGIHLIEVAPGIDVQTQVLDEMDFAPIVDRDADGNVKLMDARIFKDEVMGMTIE